MITLDGGEPLAVDIAFERQHQATHEALNEILANTHPTDVAYPYGDGDYLTGVRELHERVVYAEPWQRLGEIVLRGPLGESVTQDDLTVKVAYPNDRLEQRIAEVSGEMAAICLSPQPEDASKLALLELDHILLSAQRSPEVERSEIVAVALSGIEQVEHGMQYKYQALLEQDNFVELFEAEFGQLAGQEVSVDDVMTLEKQAFDSIVAKTYEVEELQELHGLAVAMQEEIELREQVLAIARKIVPNAADAAEERIAEIIPTPPSLVLAA